MNDWLMKNYKKICSKIFKKPFQYGFWSIIAILIIPLLIWLAYLIGDTGFIFIKTSLEVGDALVFYGSLLSFIGTVALGIIALWQNRKFKQENDKSQNRIEQLANQANSISAQLLNMEKDKFRPYIRITKKEPYMAISKGALGFSDETYKRIDDCDIKFEGQVPFDTENYSRCLSSCYPETIIFTFEIDNIGQAVIGDFRLTRVVLLDGVTGTIKSFIRSIDSSILCNEKKKIGLVISNQVVLTSDEDILHNNVISNKYQANLQRNIRMFQIEMTVSYRDIFGREYTQEYSIHSQYDLDLENNNEFILNLTKYSVEHHVGFSPYGPRED